MFVFPDMSKVQDDEVGDGTTSVTVLAAELLRVKYCWPRLKISRGGFKESRHPTLNAAF